MILSDEMEYCDDCSRIPKSFERCCPAFNYEGKIKDSIYDFKYKNQRGYAGFYADCIIKKYGEMLKGIIYQGFRVAVIVIILNNAIYAAMDLTLNPVMETGLNFAQLLNNTESVCNDGAEYLQGIKGYDPSKGFDGGNVEGGLSVNVGKSILCSLKKLEDEPIDNASEYCYSLRRVVNSDESRQLKVLEIFILPCSHARPCTSQFISKQSVFSAFMNTPVLPFISETFTDFYGLKPLINPFTRVAAMLICRNHAFGEQLRV